MPTSRQPIHTFYGGAHLFRAGTAPKMGALALQAIDRTPPCYPPDLLADVREKLRREPIEDYRIDFEDGYGVRSDSEEDTHAGSVAREVKEAWRSGALPPFWGIRIKPGRERGLRTVDRFVREFGADLPPGFSITLPKVTGPEDLQHLPQDWPVEVMIETAQSIPRLREIVDAAGPRLRAAHFGPYDFTASCGIAAAHQSLLHPVCDYARAAMLIAFAGTKVWLSDGPTTILPVGDSEAVRSAWDVHYRHIRHSLSSGFYQSWDLHPAQLVARYTAVYSFYRENLADAEARWKNFVSEKQQATRVGNVFDDAATGAGLRNFFERGLNCGALSGMPE